MMRTHSQMPSTEIIETIRRRFQDIHLPAWAKSIDLELGENQYGEPALWINVSVEKDASPTREKVSALRILADRLEQIAIEDGSPYWPYVEYSEID